MAILTVLFLIFAVVNLSAQSSKPKNQVPTVRSNVDRNKPIDTPCGVHFKNFDDFVAETKDEWRHAGESEAQSFFYNTRKTVCEKGILKVWIKTVQKDETTSLAYSMDRVDLNCRSNQQRLMSTIKYKKGGAVIDSFTSAAPKWEDLVPDSIGELIQRTICHIPF